MPTVLLVEDESPILECLRCALECAGYTVLSATSGASAIRICHAHHGSIDALVSDVLMSPVTTFPHLMEEQARVLKTIAALGPEKALRHTDYYRHGYDVARNKHIQRRRNLLDLAGIADAMGVKKQKVKNLLKDTRRILRDMFNPDGRFFASS